MGRYRVLQAFEIGTGSSKKMLDPGALVEVELRSEAERLTGLGYIGPWNRSHRADPRSSCPAGPNVRTKRIGIWLQTSRYYSGGRIHLYQIGHTLAMLGAEVYLITDGVPKWGRDYPKCDRLQLIIEGDGRPPADLDICLTDAKSGYGEKALHYKKAHPRTIFACLNFETPNWVESFVPDYAGALPQNKGVFAKADMLLANSRESALWLNRWLGRADDDFVGVLLPAVNSYALQEAMAAEPSARDRPYAVWSARRPPYKGGDLAIRSIMELPFPCDLIMIGQPPRKIESTADHRIIAKEQITDAQKLLLMRDASLVLAPSLFEGAGMVPMEALSVGTPVAVYDLPVLREIYGDKLLYARWGDEAHYRQIVADVIGSDERHEREGVCSLTETTKRDRADAALTYGMEAMRDTVESIPYLSVKRSRVSAHMVCYWGFVPESLESIYPYADEILIAFGRVPHAPEVDDGSWGRLQAWIGEHDRAGKIRVEHRDIWQGGKLEMRRWCAQRLTGNYHLLLDGDEIWTGMEAWLRDPPAHGCPRWVNLWHGPDHWIHDRDGEEELRWGHRVDPWGSWCHHYRWSWWRPSYQYALHTRINDANGERIGGREYNREIAKARPETAIYHLGHAQSKAVMEAKHNFYLSRDGNDAKRKLRKAAWHDWGGEAGECADGIVCPVDWELPEIVRRGVHNLEETHA